MTIFGNLKSPGMYLRTLEAYKEGFEKRQATVSKLLQSIEHIESHQGDKFAKWQQQLTDIRSELEEALSARLDLISEKMVVDQLNLSMSENVAKVPEQLIESYRSVMTRYQVAVTRLDVSIDKLVKLDQDIRHVNTNTDYRS